MSGAHSVVGRLHSSDFEADMQKETSGPWADRERPSFCRLAAAAKVMLVDLYFCKKWP